ncbi:MAG: SDR family NAD(P)-dependent oxidoreductase, partial [Devosia sp.]
MDLGLKNKLAVITGGSVGIGLAVAEAFAAEGANVLITARNAERVANEAARIGSTYGVTSVGVAADVATAAGCDRVIAEAARLGGADVLINNAGTGSNETIADATDDKWQYYWDLHVMAAARLGRGLAPQMKAH